MSASAPIPTAPLSTIDHRLGPSLADDVRREYRVRVRRGAKLPAGTVQFSLRNTLQIITDPVGLLHEHYRRFGPVFTMRALHEPTVWALGAEATHQILVTDADAFSWREGRFRDLHALLGDGLLNIDGAHHQGFRRLLLPAFHAARVKALSERVIVEALDAAERIDPARPLDVYHWTRDVAMRIALRVLVGLELDRPAEHALAEAFETSLSIHGEAIFVQLLRFPGTPWARTVAARERLDRLILQEIRRRRARGVSGEGTLGMLLDATDEEGRPLPEQMVRDQLVTILFAGHDTTTATLTFLLYELNRWPDARRALEHELAELVPSGTPTPDQLDGTALPVLERTLMETLRRWPPAWVGPRRTTRDVTLAGREVPAEVSVNYSSWATHHLPDLWPDPQRFDPDRFLPEQIVTRPKGAYVPFGAGSRTCLGKRFGEMELRALAVALLSRYRFRRDPFERPKITTTPTLGPADGLIFSVDPR